jgi:hypothetical protein
MTRELIGGYPAADGREQIGRFLRYAFPLGLGSFPELLNDLENKERAKSRR